MFSCFNERKSNQLVYSFVWGCLFINQIFWVLASFLYPFSIINYQDLWRKDSYLTHFCRWPNLNLPPLIKFLMSIWCIPVSVPKFFYLDYSGVNFIILFIILDLNAAHSKSFEMFDASSESMLLVPHYCKLNAAQPCQVFCSTMFFILSPDILQFTARLL